MDRGEGWYRAHFVTDKPRCGESSPNYTDWPRFEGVPERMRRSIPQARLIYCVRDPVARAVSHYKHRLADGRETRAIDEALWKERYVSRSSYHTQIMRFLDAGWPLEAIRVVQAEAMRRDPVPTIEGVLRHIGADVSHATALGVERKAHASDVKRVPTERGRALAERLEPVLSIVPWHARAYLHHAALRPFSTPMPPSSPSPATIERLRERLGPEAEGLRALTGLALPGWSV